MNARDARLVIVTAGDERQAASIARTLVDERLAACVNMIGPIRSVYRWRDAVEDESEYLLLVKTRAAMYKRVEARVTELHGYEVPEVLAITPSAGSARYLEWLGESVASPRSASTRTAPARTRARRRPRV
ncbi:MAG TPA: divalent-cation tolerance protein CutA [Candidatus Binataceae bacterium]|nr:divalent-cation tolerance protein CutA [Candidatus Binataceae bacterium]